MLTSSLGMEPSWGHAKASCFRDDLGRNPSLDSNLGNHNSLGNNLGEGDRQALGSNCPQLASSWRYLAAWEETRLEEQKLTQNPHFTQLRAEVDNLKECIGHLVRLLDSFHRESPVQNLHVGEQACTDKLEQRRWDRERSHRSLQLANLRARRRTQQSGLLKTQARTA